MTLRAITGNGNLAGVVWDDSLYLLNVFFAETNDMSALARDLGNGVRDVEGPEGADHVYYHESLADALREIGAPATLENAVRIADNKHAHFQVLADSVDNVMGMLAMKKWIPRKALAGLMG